MTRELPKFIHDLLAAPPRAGDGVHAWLFRVARYLHSHYSVTEIESLLTERTRNCGRHVSRQEILDAIRNSIDCAWQPTGNAAPVQSAKKWPDVNKEQREAIVRDNGGLADLWELSRPRIEDNRQHTEEIVDKLFPGNPLMCCGKSNSDFDTKPRDNWRGELSKLQLIVPPLLTLPRPTERCKWTGKSRTGLVEMIAPCERNNFKPPVKAIYKRAHKYAQRGQWLIPSENLFRYLLGLAEHSTDEYLATVKARAETKQTKAESKS
jgi:hypothetical protein